jgi:signal transduction histidine kinase
MARWNLQSLKTSSWPIRYGLAVLCVVIAAGFSFVFQHYRFRDLAPPFNLAIAIATWYGGVGPAALAVLLSAACFDYFFFPPLYSFSISKEELPSFLLFVTWAAVIASFAGVRRRIEGDLRQARDHLQTEVEQRKRGEEEIRKLNEDLAKRAAQLEASNKELEAFAYSISHDLRAPVRHTVGFAELLRKSAMTSLNEKSRRYLGAIVEAANRMGALIDDLLSFSRVSRAAANYSSVSLDQIVHEAVGEARRDANQRKIFWKIDPLPEWSGDPSMLRLVMVNLISNAVKFTSTRPEAEIEIGCMERKNDHVVLFVRDNGVGFDMKYANKLFGVFQRLHSQEVFEGTGIGLATVQRIVHRHGGSVWAEGKVDGGATFYFSLSRAQG